MRYYLLFFLVLGGIILGCTDAKVQIKTEAEPQVTGSEQEVIFHLSHEPKKQTAPFSDVVQVGDTYYLAGQIGMDHEVRELVSGGIEAETRQTLENIKAVLEQHELELADVVKALVILDDMGDFATFNSIYTEYLPQKPARTTFAAESLARGAKVEIEVVAVKRD